MKPPRSLKIGPHNYTIDASAQTSRLLQEDGKLADTRAEQLLIRVRSDRPHTAVGESFVHEILHALWWDAGLAETEVEKHEEMVVTMLAPGLLETLRRNPRLVTYLTENAP